MPCPSPVWSPYLPPPGHVAVCGAVVAVMEFILPRALPLFWSACVSLALNLSTNMD